MAALSKPTETYSVDTTGETLNCSFCAKSGSEVAHLIAGPVALICDECVALSAAIIADLAAGNTPPSESPLGLLAEIRVREIVAEEVAKTRTLTEGEG